MSIAKAVFWNAGVRLALASQSPTRRRLLESCGVPFVAIAPGIDERAVEAQFFAGPNSGADLALHLAKAKAADVSVGATGMLCLGADQTLLLDNALFHKPSSREEAAAMLERLSGRTHELVSAFALFVDGALVQAGEDRAKLTMRRLSRGQIARYLDAVGDRAFGSVGGYQVEAEGIHLFEEIRGAHSTVLGLPLLPLLEAFRCAGALTL